MYSKWSELKPPAIKLRKSGISLRSIKDRLGIPKSTLSGWFRNIKLSEKHLLRLEQNRIRNLNHARHKAVAWHNNQKTQRLIEAEKQSLLTLENIDTNKISIRELALAMLYLGEGSKTKSGTSIGSSDPLILKFFIKIITSYCQIDICKIKCALHLRSDQDPEILKKYWSEELNIPLDNFTASSIDKRTVKSPTYPTYNGVCVVSCGNIALQRKLVYLSRKFCELIINDKGGLDSYTPKVELSQPTKCIKGG